jgi:hypothetical protein
MFEIMSILSYTHFSVNKKYMFLHCASLLRIITVKKSGTDLDQAFMKDEIFPIF